MKHFALTFLTFMSLSAPAFAVTIETKEIVQNGQAVEKPVVDPTGMKDTVKIVTASTPAPTPSPIREALPMTERKKKVLQTVIVLIFMTIGFRVYLMMRRNK